MSMISGISLDTTQSTHWEPRASTPAHESRGSFSRATHFALVLIPVFLGQGWVLLRHYLSGAVTPVDHDAVLTPMLISDSNGWLHLIVYAFFLFGLGSALMLLHAVRRVEQYEENATR